MESVLLGAPSVFFRPRRGSNLAQKNLEERFRMFTTGMWMQLLINSEACACNTSMQRRPLQHIDDTGIIPTPLIVALNEPRTWC